MKRRIALLILMALSSVSCSTLHGNISVMPLGSAMESSSHDFKGEKWIGEMRYLKSRRKLAISVNRKEEDAILREFIVMNADGSNKQRIDAESYSGFYESAADELPKETKRRLAQFLEDNFSSHEGILGRTVNYSIVNKTYSPTRNRIAFMIQGEDGHAILNSSLYVADRNGERITEIASDLEEMCQGIIWISGNEIIYAKGMELWKTEIK